MMTEIERIIKDYLHSRKTHRYLAQFGLDEKIGELAKAIEQYVIKARIEELEKIEYGDNKNKYWDKVQKRIAELKKGLDK